MKNPRSVARVAAPAKAHAAVHGAAARLRALLKGDAAGALAEIEQETTENWKAINLPMAYHALGRKSDAEAALAALISKFEKESAFNIAYVYAFSGEEIRRSSGSTRRLRTAIQA